MNSADERSFDVVCLKEAISKIGTNEVVAQHFETSKETISRWRRGVSSPSFEDAIEISRLSGISLDRIAGITLYPDDIVIDLSVVNTALWAVLDPLIDQELLTISNYVDREKLSLSLSKALKRGGGTGMGKASMEPKQQETAPDALKAAIENSELSLEELATATGISIGEIQELLADETVWTARAAVEFAKVLNVSPMRFLSPGVPDPWGDEFFERWLKLSDGDKLEAVSVLQSLARNRDLRDD